MVTRVALFAAALAACTPSTYRVKRSALVPQPAPIARSGQPMGDSLAEVALGSDTVAGPAPEQGDPEAGLVVPRLQADIAARFRAVVPELDFGAVYRRGLSRDAYRLGDDIANPGNDASVFGATVAYSMATSDPRFRVGLAAELGIVSVPYVVYETCVSNCAGQPFTAMKHDSEPVADLAAAVIPSFRLGRFTLFGGVTARNHPTIDKKDEVTNYTGDHEAPRAGGAAFIVNAGVDAELGAGVRAGLSLYQVLPGAAADYGPTLSAGLTIPLARRAAPTPRATTSP